MLRFALIAALAVTGSTTAMAQPSAQAPMNAPEPITNSSTTADTSSTDPDRIICRNVKPPTGTRIASARSRQRVCMTKADWEQQEREAQEALRVRDSGVCSPGECGGPG